ncbi:TIGR00725 family protein [Thermodesulfobacterium thermophilum]|uniref:TIGR00725 family protein n=1 Tax=Thermodesulfobacterium thermophilum TaxID=886 RepID=UPI0003B34372|nr:TIGR00725 family protein [Thermodesulfobacterium thermophilum]
MDLKNRRIAVVGAGIADESTYQIAYTMGKLLGEKGAIVYTGGLGGVMEAACKGAFKAGATTVGILPGHKPEEANPYVKVLVLSDMGHARNVILIRSVEAVIAISGGYGTLSEIALALKMWKPVIGINTWENIPGVNYVSSPEKALAKLLEFFS